ncbi:MAG: hypothetical protein ACOYWZ_23275 [Bacillota bacterium]
MHIYTAMVFTVIVLSSCMMIYISNKSRFLNQGITIVAAAGSLLISILFPGIISTFIKISNSYGIVFALIIGIITCVVLVLIFTTLASSLDNGGKLHDILKATGKFPFMLSINNEYSMDQDDFKADGLVDDPYTLINGGEKNDFASTQKPYEALQGKNILEKSVDSERNIDKMGVETITSLSITNASFGNALVGDTYNNEQEGLEVVDIIKPECQGLKAANFTNINDINEYEAQEDFFEEENVNDNDIDDLYLECEESFAREADEDIKARELSENEDILETDISIVDEVPDELGLTVAEDVPGIEGFFEFESFEVPDGTDEKKALECEVVLEEALQENDNETEDYLDKMDGSPQTIKEGVFDSFDDKFVNISSEAVEEIAVIAEVSTDLLSDDIELAEQNEEISGLNTDKDMDIIDCIDEAFRLKESGDPEGAILNYFYALDKQPENDIVFWLILDICVLYKELGQVELAKDILESYVSEYGDVMDEAVRFEIERNL